MSRLAADFNVDIFESRIVAVQPRITDCSDGTVLTQEPLHTFPAEKSKIEVWKILLVFIFKNTRKFFFSTACIKLYFEELFQKICREFFFKCKIAGSFHEMKQLLMPPHSKV